MRIIIRFLHFIFYFFLEFFRIFFSVIRTCYWHLDEIELPC